VTTLLNHIELNAIAPETKTEWCLNQGKYNLAEGNFPKLPIPYYPVL
jgi:hypothetical protein